MNAIAKIDIAWRTILDGIEAYKKQYGREPAVLILHPRLLQALKLDRPGRAGLLKNVRIRTSPLFDEPVLANEKGEPFEVTPPSLRSADTAQQIVSRLSGFPFNR